MILVCPRSLKSLLVSGMYPAWLWTTEPTNRILSVSNSEDLAIRLADNSRRIIMSDWYQRFWNIEFNKKFNSKTIYENIKGGRREVLGIGSTATGKGGDTLLIDDIHDAKEAESPIKLKSTVEFGMKLFTRINKTWGNKSKVIVIQQMIHPNDFVNTLLEMEPNKWEVLRLPVRYNPKYRTTSKNILGFVDYRTKVGESLDPIMWSEEVLEDKAKNTFEFASQYMQEAISKEGLAVKIDNIKFFSERPPKEEWFYTLQSWDTASLKERGCKWCRLNFIVTKEGIYIDDMRLERMGYVEGKEKVMSDVKDCDYPIDYLLVENANTGIALIQELETIPEYATILEAVPVSTRDNKIVRMEAELGVISEGRLYIRDKIKDDILLALRAFPCGKLQDVIDALSQGLRKIKEMKFYEPYELCG